ARSAPRVHVPWRASQRRTAVSATRRASRSASSFIASKGRHTGGVHPRQPHVLAAPPRRVHAGTVVLPRAGAAVAVAVEGHGVAAAHAVALAADEVFVGAG